MAAKKKDDFYLRKKKKHNVSSLKTATKERKLF